MKRIALYLGLATALAASCSIQEEDFKTPQQDDVLYYASFEQPTEEGTRVYANEGLFLRWTADDRVSIFEKNTYNQQFRFTGETGDNAGGFKKVAGDDYYTGSSIPNVVSVYPYLETTKISESGVLTVDLPAEQHYAENTFGLGANTMVSVSEDNYLQYKNVCGYLRLSLYGDGISVSSITLKGYNDEKLAGKASVLMPCDGLPSVEMASEADDVITLTCDSPVTLGKSIEESRDFWFVVPPVVFRNGFSILINDISGEVYEKSTLNCFVIERNRVSKMSPTEIETNQPLNTIYYRSSDGELISPYNVNAFGVNIVSNEYLNNLGIITFDGDLTFIGDRAFMGCKRLTSIRIPSGVTSIGARAFQGCTGLSVIHFPANLTSLEDWAFESCTGLTSFNLPESIERIGYGAFDNCSNLTTFTIPRRITSIEGYTFCNCKKLTHVIISENVTSIGEDAFYGCSNLVGIRIPEGVTSIGESAFLGCRSLTSINLPTGLAVIENGVFGDSGLTEITIPSGVMFIKEWAFNECSNLAHISFPTGLLSIGEYAFSWCTSLTSINLPESVIDIGEYAFNHCSGLHDIVLSDGLSIIGRRAFKDCTNLTRIYIPDSVTSIGEGAFLNCESLVSFGGQYASSDGLLLVDSGVLIAAACGAINGSIVVPQQITNIGIGAFFNCSTITSISIPDSVRTIGAISFSGCSHLSEIIIPGSVTSIGDEAFSRCNNLSCITVLAELPPTGGWGMFAETPNPSIFVPSGSIDAYKSAEYWSDYANRIQAISQ